MKAAEIAPGLSGLQEVPAVCRDFAAYEVLAISGNRHCTRGENSALMVAHEVELLRGGTGRDEQPRERDEGQL